MVVRTERGWAGHFICSNRCRFRRNTLLMLDDVRVVVSTVGLLELKGKIESIGADSRYYETMAFHALLDERYWDADVSRQVEFNSPWAIDVIDVDDKANEMHEAVVDELICRLEAGEKL